MFLPYLMVSYFCSSKNSRLVLFSPEPPLFRKSFKTAFTVSLLCACKLPECYFLQAIDWAASVMCVSHMWPTSSVYCGLSVKYDVYSKCLYVNTGPHTMLDESSSLLHHISFTIILVLSSKWYLFSQVLCFLWVFWLKLCLDFSSEIPILNT